MIINMNFDYAEQQQKTIKEQQEQKSNESKEKSIGYITDLEEKKNKNDYLIYGACFLLVLVVVIYEFKNKK